MASLSEEKAVQGEHETASGLSSEVSERFLTEISRKACMVESLASVLPPMWRRAKYRVAGLKSASHYNGIVGVVKGVKKDSGRMMVQLQNEEKSEISVKRANLELAEPCLKEEQEPLLAMTLERLKLSKSDDLPRTQEGLESAVRNWAQGLLDITFQVENDMVEKEFENRELFDEVRGMLADVEAQCLTLTSALKTEGNGASPPTASSTQEDLKTEQPAETSAMIEWLGESMAECMHWRRGALCYMLTATLASDGRPLDRGVLEEGLEELDRMLQTRGKRMGAAVADAEGDDGVRAMVQACILSDTHLLAVVYAGEMCYWACTEGKEAEECEVQFRARMREKGVAKLAQYLQAVRIMSKDGGGGVGAGWDTSRAEQLLGALNASESAA